MNGDGHMDGDGHWFGRLIAWPTIPQGARTAAAPVRHDGAVRVPRWAVDRLGLGPGDAAVVAVYRGIVCVWASSPPARPCGDPTFLGEHAAAVGPDGTVTVAGRHLRLAGLRSRGRGGRGERLTLIVWGDEVSIS